MSRFLGPPASPSELHWRGLVLRSEVEPPAEVKQTRPLLKATLRAGRWEVTPNREGKQVAAWCNQTAKITSTRDTAEAALEALLSYLLNSPRSKPLEPPLPDLVEDLQALGLSVAPDSSDALPRWADPFLRRHGWTPAPDGTWARSDGDSVQHLPASEAFQQQVTQLESQLGVPDVPR